MCCSDGERPFLHRPDLLTQFEHARFPITLRVKPWEGGRKRGIVPAAGKPRRVVNESQRAQRFDQMQLARLEVAEVFVAGQQVDESMWPASVPDQCW